MILLRLEDPVQIAVTVLDIGSQVDSDEDVDSQALARFLDQWYLELSENLAPGTITAEEVLGADLVGVA